MSTTENGPKTSNIMTMLKFYVSSKSTKSKANAKQKVSPISKSVFLGCIFHQCYFKDWFLGKTTGKLYASVFRGGGGQLIGSQRTVGHFRGPMWSSG